VDLAAADPIPVVHREAMLGHAHLVPGKTADLKRDEALVIQA